MRNIINSPITINNRTINNRIVFNPMEGCDGTADGAIGELTRRRYLRFATGNAGIIWFEATSVSDECRANPRQLYLNEKTKNSFKSLLTEIKKVSLEKCGFAPVIVMQMTHSGRFSKPNGLPAPIIAYHNALWEKGREEQPYTVASDEYCDGIIKKYARCARLASEVGFDGIDVKCCHGYLFDEFLSAYNRQGRYAGSFENRTRLYFDCIDAVKANISPDMFVTTRLNATDYFPHGYGYGVDENDNIDLTEAKMIVSSLVEKGIELIDITIGNPYLIPHINRPCINAPEDGRTGVERIVSVTRDLQKSFPDIAFVLSGLSYMGENAVDFADEALKNGSAKLAGFGRMTFCYPSFYSDYLEKGKPDKNKCCLKCSKCTELMRSGSVTGCPVRDSETYMPYYKKYVLNGEEQI